MISLAKPQLRKIKSVPSFRQEGRERFQSLIFFRQEHALLYAPLLLGIGIAFYFSLTFEPYSSVVFNGWVGSLALLLLLQQVYALHPEYNIFRILAFILCLVISGFFLAQNRTIQVHAPVLSKELKFANVTGRVADVEVMAEKHVQRLTLTDLQIEELKRQETPYSVRVTVRGEQPYHPGDVIKILAGLNPPSGPVAPGAFDFQRQSYFKRLGAVGFTYRQPEIIQTQTVGGFFAFWENLRLFVTNNIQSSVPPELQGVMITFMTGEKSSIAEDDLNAMRDSGLAHLLAISGLHVGLVGGFVFFFVRLGLACFPSIVLQYPIKKWAAGVALIFAFFYMFLVGASVPTQRAMMMTGIALFAIMIDRSPFSLRMVALAALIILIFYPEVLLSASFQMSFAAVTALVAFYDSFRPQIQNLYREAGIVRKVFLYFAGILATTLIAGSATALYGIYHFQAWSLYSTLANLMAMPVVGMVVMPAAVLSYLLMLFGLAEYPLMLMGVGIDWVLYIAHYVASLDGAVIHLPAFSSSILVLLTLGFLFFLIGPKIFRILGGLFLLAGIMGVLNATPQDQLLISDHGNLVGFYEQDTKNLYFSSFQKERYVRENWARGLGVHSDQNVKKLSAHQNVKCDHSGCRLEWKGQKVALSDDLYSLQKDCLWADIVITKRSLPSSCLSATKVDYWFLKKQQATKITFPFALETVSQQRGQRLWTSH